MKGKMGEQYSDFSKKWYQMRNSSSHQQFYYLWNKLIVEFPDAVLYLNRALFNEKEHWAICYIFKVFNAGMQSTQRVEGQNAIIKNLEIAQAIWYISCLIDDFEDLELQSNSTELSNLTQSSNLSDLTERSLTERFNSTELSDSIEQSNSTEVFVMFIEDTINASAILLINRLLKKAIQTGLDAGANAIKELQDFINSFINKIRKPVVHSKRGAPKKKQFKGSDELVSKKKSSAKEHSNAQKTKKQTQCQQCQNTGHNKAGCEVWHKRQDILYSY
ncbi:protein far1-related sequence 11-like [Gigaspora margarita]|uniref:Protein far1-related sequence 11-like n=1 Tax=Gigaspora margarita TaxID=4874 RepID=A0A8H4EU67_GIGMA|nr:protein far1-related sequence 11-like [Gigaspora margarita]